MPAGTAVTVHVKSVWLGLNPPTLLVVPTQVEAAPVIVHATLPAGAVAPTIPLTVAVKVIFPPNNGLAGELVIAMVGVAAVTIFESGGVEEVAE